MLGGALAGGALLRWVETPAPLWAAAVVLGCCAVAAAVAARRPQSDVWA
jgi:predicted MFS family arabinose efflux permease